MKKLVPAGVSKRTGMSYSEFWACPNKCGRTGAPTGPKGDGNAILLEEIQGINLRLDKLIAFCVKNIPDKD